MSIGKNKNTIILGIIPARGGSKTIPKKNIKNMAGKPLIAWTIDSAKKSKLLDRFVVSTEDKEIGDISKKYGAEVLARPEKLAGDKVSIIFVLKDVLRKTKADIVVLLQPTSPIKEKDLIDKCLKRFIAKKADSLATGFMCYLYEWGKYQKQRQDLKAWFHDDGNVYILKADLIKKAKNLNEAWGRKREKFLISKEQNFEIDDEFDFWINEQILIKKYKKNKTLIK